MGRRDVIDSLGPMRGRARVPARKPWLALAVVLAGVAVAGCASSPDRKLPPLALADHVDLPRFMGDWYVIASIPTFLEKGAHNPKENYRLDADGTIATTFTFNADAFDGPLRTYESRGYVLDQRTNAIWGQQYVWPIKADYRIAYVSDDYAQTVVAREKRDYVWIMARTPSIPDADLRRLTDFVAKQGYDPALLVRAPTR
ncbi:lipocalin family protein [Variovorax dokdonensis]|uniref:Outer membrane lipoprotein Blc n=1 Tax=Variovorax dokdonensis TaxID=344883 RepID=A0ABT7N984_9BURK|nr:lipocalin family protein [Variovorax dokdonensis]MDM0044507.1 lipocalin family protein [Variovorax dokdonensis]